MGSCSPLRLGGLHVLMPHLADRVGGNSALTTGVLVFGFVAADRMVPVLLEAMVCGLSRLRRRTLRVFTSVRA